MTVSANFAFPERLSHKKSDLFQLFVLVNASKLTTALLSLGFRTLFFSASL